MTPQSIIETTAAVNGISLNDILSTRRKHAVARIEAGVMLNKHTSLSSPAIGRCMGGRDHTTVLHWLKNAARVRPGNIQRIEAILEGMK